MTFLQCVHGLGIVGSRKFPTVLGKSIEILQRRKIYGECTSQELSHAIWSDFQRSDFMSIRGTKGLRVFESRVIFFRNIFFSSIGYSFSISLLPLLLHEFLVYGTRWPFSKAVYRVTFKLRTSMHCPDLCNDKLL